MRVSFTDGKRPVSDRLPGSIGIPKIAYPVRGSTPKYRVSLRCSGKGTRFFKGLAGSRRGQGRVFSARKILEFRTIPIEVLHHLTNSLILSTMRKTPLLMITITGLLLSSCGGPNASAACHGRWRIGETEQEMRADFPYPNQPPRETITVAGIDRKIFSDPCSPGRSFLFVENGHLVGWSGP